MFIARVSLGRSVREFIVCVILLPSTVCIPWMTAFEGLVVIAPMLGGGLAAAQAMAVTTGLPFTIVLMVATVSLVKGLMDEPRPTSKSMKKAKA